MQVTDEMVERAQLAADELNVMVPAKAMRAALTAALSDKQAVEVKALDWHAEPPYHVARVFGNVYAVEAWDGGVTLSGIGGRRDFKTVSEAKTAAQADYEQRIRSALVDVPAVEPVAWREIEGYQGLYEVSSGGDVRSIQTGRLLAKNLAGSGYVKADLWKNGKRWQTTVHRLVADAFLEKKGSEINHINGVKTDNRVENLEWCTRSENVSHSFYVLSKRVRPVEAYNPGTGEKRHYRSVCEAARDGFKSSQIYRALKNPNRTVKGFHWQESSPPLSREGEDSAEVIAKSRALASAILQHFAAMEDGDGNKAPELAMARDLLAATRSGSATTPKGCAE